MASAEFRKKFRELRKNKGYSQEKIAEGLDVSRQIISRWENGDAYPNAKHLFALADALDCNVADLTGGGETIVTKKMPIDRIVGWILTITIVVVVSCCVVSATVFDGATQKQDTGVNNVKAALFDKIANGFVDGAINNAYGGLKGEIMGYGISEGDNTFYIKYKLDEDFDDSDADTVIIYFYEENGEEKLLYDFLENSREVPRGEYYSVDD